MSGAVPIGHFQFIAYPPITQKRQAFLRYRRTRDIPAQPFQLATLVCFCHHPGMQAETRYLGNPARTRLRLFYRRQTLQIPACAGMTASTCVPSELD